MIDPRYEELQDMREAGRHEARLALIQLLLAEAESEPEPDRTRFFMPMFEWRLLLEEYGPARAALEARRDAQAELLMKGELHLGRAALPVDDHAYDRVVRFHHIIQMNEELGDARSTYDIFRQLEVQRPELARSYAWRALEAMVDVGDFALADHYRRPPLDGLHNVNFSARELPLFPPPDEAPRLAADLSNLVKEVRIGIAVLRGLGDPAGADNLRQALLDGLVSPELRDFARRELDEPGTITREGVVRRMAEEERQGL